MNNTNHPSIERAIPMNDVLEVHFENWKTIKFQNIWLRDNCRCAACYHADTYQRAKHILELPNVNIVHVTHNKIEITVKWSDNHDSTYTAEFLSQFDYVTWKSSRQIKPILWSGEKVGKKVTRIHVDNFLNSFDGTQRVFQSLLDYGVAFIEGVEASLEATEVVCKALGGIQHTLFGGMWQINTFESHADTAYTNLHLPSHNDNTYFSEAAGLQVLHCLEHSNGTGGESTLVDGFYGASRLSEEHPEDYKFLTTFDIEAQYIEKNYHYRYSAPVIQVDRNTQHLKQIRFNVNDRAAMAFDRPEDCKLYYRSLRNLSRYYEDKNNKWQFKLIPGVVMVIDNFRVLHGRTGFSGTRVLCGCYVSRSDWLSKARTLNLIQ